MSHDPLSSFQRHLETQSKRPGPQDSYVGVLACFLRTIDLSPSANTAEQVYQHLVDRGTAAGLSRSWYNVIFETAALHLVLQMR